MEKNKKDASRASRPIPKPSAANVKKVEVKKTPKPSPGRFDNFSSPEIKKMKASEQPFSKWNFFLIGCCGVLIIIGFLLMLGGGSSVEGGFNPDIFSTRRIVVGPLLAFLGFLFMAFAIFIDPEKIRKSFKKFKERKEQDKKNTNHTVVS